MKQESNANSENTTRKVEVIDSKITENTKNKQSSNMKKSNMDCNMENCNIEDKEKSMKDGINYDYDWNTEYGDGDVPDVDQLNH